MTDNLKKLKEKYKVPDNDLVRTELLGDVGAALAIASSLEEEVELLNAERELFIQRRHISHVTIEELLQAGRISEKEALALKGTKK